MQSLDFRGFLANLEAPHASQRHHVTLCLRLTLRWAAVPRSFSQRRQRLGSAKGVGGLTCRPRPSQAAARGWNGPTHWQRKGKQKERDLAWDEWEDYSVTWHVPLLEMVGKQKPL